MANGKHWTHANDANLRGWAQRHLEDALRTADGVDVVNVGKFYAPLPSPMAGDELAPVKAAPSTAPHHAPTKTLVAGPLQSGWIPTLRACFWTLANSVFNDFEEALRQLEGIRAGRAPRAGDRSRSSRRS